ncbi:MAG: excinuclease ABC subunit UvrC [Candidatus Sumerlaeia bacterium]|nr:excinuclease ABC subunit UvrC [Candidatus Sumerlaeia bacterium]
MPNINLEDFPARPGVYLMKDATGTVIYVGKAKNLRQRIRAYFQESSGDQRLFIPFLRRRVQNIDFIITDSEKESLLLENTLIKKYKPRYNIKLVDDKTYVSLRINPSAEYPRLEIIRRREPGDGAVYFGPFSSAAAVKETLRFIQRIFPLRMCKDSQFKNRTRPCLLYEVGKCLAPCTKPVSKTEYRQLVDGVILFLKGQKEQVIKYLKKLMEDYAEKLEFEKAALVRDKILAIQKTIEQQKVASYKGLTLDAIGIACEDERAQISILHYRQGLLEESRNFFFNLTNIPLLKPDSETEIKDKMSELLSSFIGQFYGAEKFVPPEIICAVEPADKETLTEWLSDLAASRVKISVPKRGERKKIIELANENARLKLSAEKAKSADTENLLIKVQQALGLKRLPRRIECFDISNIMGTAAVGSMVSFYNALPDKSNYRRFKIKNTAIANDYEMIKEVITRRYKRLQAEEKEMPDLILIDGGKGQLNIAQEVLNELGIRDIALAAIAKGRDLVLRRARGSVKYKDRTREKLYDHVYIPQRKNPVHLSPGSDVLLFLQRIRDEAHRFALEYHKKLRTKMQITTGLEQIKGIGKKRKIELLQYFGSVEQIKNASIDELVKMKGLGIKTARKIYEYFHPEVQYGRGKENEDSGN